MRTPTNRRQHSRDHLRYETDLTDAEWAVVEPLMPEPCRRGRPRTWPLREIMNAIFSCCEAASRGAALEAPRGDPRLSPGLLYAASVMLLIRRLARQTSIRPPCCVAL